MDLRSLKYKSKAEKFVSKCDKALGDRIIKRINRLLVEPYSSDIKILKGNEKLCRVRVGDYRILYEVIVSEKKIVIHDIDKRSKVYRLRDEETEEYN